MNPHRLLLGFKEPLRKVAAVAATVALSTYHNRASNEAAPNHPSHEASVLRHPTLLLAKEAASTSFPTPEPTFTAHRFSGPVAYCEAAPSKRIVSYTYPANEPTEDRNISGVRGPWTYSAVFDGHGGPQVAELASRHLMDKIFTRLDGSDVRNEQQIEERLTLAFNDMEQEIVDQYRPIFEQGYGQVAKVGSCVLVALRQANKLIIANCGDCRAVLGSQERPIYNNEQKTQETLQNYSTRINRDHNCREPLEQEHLKRAHPNEPNLIVCKNAHACYVKGRLQLTRSLGDLYLKHAEFNGNPAIGRSAGRYIPEPYTPPYVSHTPDVHQLLLEKEDRFVILGSDGLWDYLPGKEAVAMVFEGMTRKENEETLAKRLVERALEIAASECGMTLSELKQLPAGRPRRGRHDDTTAVVMFL